MQTVLVTKNKLHFEKIDDDYLRAVLKRCELWKNDRLFTPKDLESYWKLFLTVSKKKSIPFRAGFSPVYASLPFHCLNSDIKQMLKILLID